ncbi:MAG: hypothetical protein AB7N76_28605 [Planctomycetota bacterium]
MTTAALPPEVVEPCLRALKSVALIDGKVHPLERELLDSLQRHVLRTELCVDALAPIEPDELAEAVTDPEHRAQVLHGCIMMTLIDGDAAPGEVQRVDAYADALGVHDASLQDLHRFADHSFRLLRLDLLRRFIAADRMKKEVHDRGLLSLLGVLKTQIMGGDAAVAARYQALEQLPDGTLGREYFRFIRDNGFALPGEKGGAPEPIVFHDANHVLGSYGTTPEEESQVAAFHAGYRGHDKFGLLLFILMQFHLGVWITPTADGYEGRVDPELVFKAFERGTQVNTDLVTEWDPREDWAVPLEELRRRFNVLPRS